MSTIGLAAAAQPRKALAAPPACGKQKIVARGFGAGAMGFSQTSDAAPPRSATRASPLTPRPPSCRDGQPAHVVQPQPLTETGDRLHTQLVFQLLPVAVV